METHLTRTQADGLRISKHIGALREVGTDVYRMVAKLG
jgi:hypothetical protein